MAADVTAGFVELYSQDTAAINKQNIVDKSPESVTDDVENQNGHDIIEYEMKEYLQQRLAINIIQPDKRSKEKPKIANSDADMVVDIVQLDQTVIEKKELIALTKNLGSLNMTYIYLIITT